MSEKKGELSLRTQKWQVMGETFELENRYKIVDYLGSGAYGVVCAVNDSIENKVVAIKKCKKIFLSRTLAKRTLREVRLLRLFNHDNIVKLKNILIPDDIVSFSELYIVFELMETDLAQIIRSPQKLKEQHTQYFTYQLLQALKYLHSENVVHRDLKPRNILVNADCCLKLADFGLARVYNSTNDDHITVLTDYVTTRWYRAPEVIVGWPRYTSAVDMWAVGCIVAELIGRTPLFPGADTMKQMELISKIMGKPDEQFIKRCRKAAYKQYLYSLQNTKTNELLSLIPYGNPLAIDLILNLLEYNPSLRFSAEQALSHTYIAEIGSTINTDASPLVVPPDEFAYETRELTIDILRHELLREVKYHNPSFQYFGGMHSETPTLSVDALRVDLGTIELNDEQQQFSVSRPSFDSHSRSLREHARRVSDSDVKKQRLESDFAVLSADVDMSDCATGSRRSSNNTRALTHKVSAQSVSARDAMIARRQQLEEQRLMAMRSKLPHAVERTRETGISSGSYKPPAYLHHGNYSGNDHSNIELQQLSREQSQDSHTVQKAINKSTLYSQSVGGQRGGGGGSSTASASSMSMDSRTVMSSQQHSRQHGTTLIDEKAVVPTSYPPPFNTRNTTMPTAASTRRNGAKQDKGFFTACVRSNDDELERGLYLESESGDEEKSCENEYQVGANKHGEYYKHMQEVKTANNKTGRKKTDQHLPVVNNKTGNSCIIS